jgi:hypothetical protein
MKKFVLSLLFCLLLTQTSAAEDTKQYYIQIPNKSLKVLAYGDVEVPESMGFGRTYQVMYETKTPISNKAELEKEVRQVLASVSSRLPSDYKTIYVQAEEPYTGNMVLGKNGVDFRFGKVNGEWELQMSN